MNLTLWNISYTPQWVQQQSEEWSSTNRVAGFVITAYSIHTRECYLILMSLCLNLWCFDLRRSSLWLSVTHPGRASLCVEVFPDSLSCLVLFLSQKLWNLIWGIISQVRIPDSHLDYYFRSRMWTKLAVATLLLAALLVMKPDLFSPYNFFVVRLGMNAVWTYCLACFYLLTFLAHPYSE